MIFLQTKWKYSTILSMTLKNADIQTKPKHASLEVTVSAIGADLVESLSRVLSDVPGAPYRPQQLAKHLVLNKDLTSRLVRALKKRDPIAAIHVMPGPVPLRRVISSAQKAGVHKDVVAEAASAIEAFDHLIRTEFGARSDLDAAISASLPDARERHESTAKQAAFRGAAGIRGISVDVMLVTFLLHPSQTNPQMCDTAVINSYFGLRRTRPGAYFEFTTFQEGRKSDGAGSPHPLVDSFEHPTSESKTGSLIRKFCSPAELPLEVHHEGNQLRYVMTGNGIGQRSAIDIVTQEFYPQNHPMHKEQSKSPTRWFFATTDQPASLMIFDKFVHKDVWKGCDPSLVLYDTVIKGIANPNDETRDRDRLDLYETITPLGDRRAGFRNAEVPKYIEMLSEVCSSHDWSLDDFRGYRTRMTYPFHGSQTCMIFKPFD